MEPDPASPRGTFMANVRAGAITFPVPIRNYCDQNNWTLFQVSVLDADRLEIQPVLPDDRSEFGSQYHSSLAEGGVLWIPAALRELLSLGEQSVMMRVEDGVIRIYLRKVFKTLGFGP